MSKNGRKSCLFAIVAPGSLVKVSRFMLGTKKPLEILRLYGGISSPLMKGLYFQILTNYSDRINETIELNVASKVFKVRVCEFEIS
ncbi:hypothetical protein GQ457_17G027450 [Hibiscus cannabinus]